MWGSQKDVRSESVRVMSCLGQRTISLSGGRAGSSRCVRHVFVLTQGDADVRRGRVRLLLFRGQLPWPEQPGRAVRGGGGERGRVCVGSG